MYWLRRVPVETICQSAVYKWLLHLRTLRQTPLKRGTDLCGRCDPWNQFNRILFSLWNKKLSFLLITTYSYYCFSFHFRCRFRKVKNENRNVKNKNRKVKNKNKNGKVKNENQNVKNKNRKVKNKNEIAMWPFWASVYIPTYILVF